MCAMLPELFDGEEQLITKVIFAQAIFSLIQEGSENQ